MCRGLVLTAVAPGLSPGLGTIHCMSLPLSLTLFPVIYSAVLSIKAKKNLQRHHYGIDILCWFFCPVACRLVIAIQKSLSVGPIKEDSVARPFSFQCNTQKQG